VDGFPLGILLASSWVRVFNCAKISLEIIKNIDFLTTTAPDIDQRHRSLIAVFNSSWKLMSEEERRILTRLSIFQAAFTPQAAMEICDATPLLLSIFIDKSLLSQRHDGRYEMLGTFHQYVYSKLESNGYELHDITVRFCEYYAEFCAEIQPELNDTDQINALNEIAAEMENLRNAWSWIIEADRWDLIDKMKDPLLAYHVILGNYVQGGEFFRLALLKLNKLADPQLELSRASMQQLSAWMTYRNGFTAEAMIDLNASLLSFRKQNYDWGIALTLEFLADICRSTGQFEQGIAYIKEAIEILQRDSTQKSNYVRAFTAHCQSMLGTILAQTGEYEPARRNLQTSLATHRELGTHYGTIHPLMGLGMLAYLQEDFIQAKELYLQALQIASYCNDQHDQVIIHNRLAAVNEVMANTGESYRHVLSAFKLCQETGDHLLTAFTLNNLAYQQLKYLRQPAESIWTYHKCLEIFSNSGDLRGITYTSYDMSKAYLAIGLIEEATEYCLKALRTAMTLDSIPLILHTLHGMAIIAHHHKHDERALQLLNLIIHHPAVESDTQKRAIVSRVEWETVIAPEICASALAWGKVLNLQDVVDQILAAAETQRI
jgi:tetratricopeptide (TPR) repeat protein